MRLTMKEQRKIEVIQKVMDRTLSIKQASQILLLSQRQVFRLLKKLRNKGLQAICHQNKGNQFARKYTHQLEDQILKLVKQKYQNINDIHLSEILLQREKIQIGHESLRQLLRKSGIKPKVKRRYKIYRSRRERKEAMGTMIQIDASKHDWLEGRCPKFTLIGGIDDATGYVWARFESSESCWGYMNLVEQIAMSHGLPLSLHSDRHTIFHSPKQPTIVEQLANKRPLTQFGRSMKELGVTLIKAYSAPAKGRIERLWRTLQDRLIVEMRLAHIDTMEEANLFLEDYLKAFNKRYRVMARSQAKLFKKRPHLKQLHRILCLKETRVVQKDHTVKFEGLVLQIPPSSRWASISGQEVRVFQLKDGSVEIEYKTMIVARFSSLAIQNLVNKVKPSRIDLKTAA